MVTVEITSPAVDFWGEGEISARDEPDVDTGLDSACAHDIAEFIKILGPHMHIKTLRLGTQDGDARRYSSVIELLHAHDKSLTVETLDASVGEFGLIRRDFLPQLEDDQFALEALANLARLIKKSQVQSVDISHQDFDLTGTCSSVSEHFLEQIKDCETLFRLVAKGSLFVADPVDEMIFEPVCFPPNLQILDVSQCLMTPADWKNIFLHCRPLPRLTQLNVSTNDIDDEALDAFVTCILQHPACSALKSLKLDDVFCQTLMAQGVLKENGDIIRPSMVEPFAAVGSRQKRQEETVDAAQDEDLDAPDTKKPRMKG